MTRNRRRPDLVDPDLRWPILGSSRSRMRASTGRGYYDRKISEGKTHNEAMRCLNAASLTTSGES